MKSRFEVLPNLASRGLSVFLTGDFNVPSHLDWTNATKSNHFGVSIQWPVSAKLQQLNFRDSYREIRSNPVKHPANTWTPGKTDKSARMKYMTASILCMRRDHRLRLAAKSSAKTGPIRILCLRLGRPIIVQLSPHSARSSLRPPFVGQSNDMYG